MTAVTDFDHALRPRRRLCPPERRPPRGTARHCGARHPLHLVRASPPPAAAPGLCPRACHRAAAALGGGDSLARRLARIPPLPRRAAPALLLRGHADGGGRAVAAQPPALRRGVLQRDDGEHSGAHHPRAGARSTVAALPVFLCLSRRAAHRGGGSPPGSGLARTPLRPAHHPCRGRCVPARRPPPQPAAGHQLRLHPAPARARHPVGLRRPRPMVLPRPATPGAGNLLPTLPACAPARAAPVIAPKSARCISDSPPVSVMVSRGRISHRDRLDSQ